MTLAPLRPTLALLGLLFASACGAPCEERDGSVDGYCDGNTAVNCITTCADCIDQWSEVPCTGTCSVGSEPGPEEKAGGSMPNMSHPTAYATCSDWAEEDSGDTDGS